MCKVRREVEKEGRELGGLSSRVPKEQGAQPQDKNLGSSLMLSKYINNFANHFISKQYCRIKICSPEL